MGRKKRKTKSANSARDASEIVSQEHKPDLRSNNREPTDEVQENAYETKAESMSLNKAQIPDVLQSKEGKALMKLLEIQKQNNPEMISVLNQEFLRSCISPRSKMSDIITDNMKQEIEEDLEDSYVTIQREIFLWNSCHVCKVLKSSDGNSLKKCSKCRMIYYCSREHQEQHWPKHKSLCKAICKVCKQENMTYIFEKAFGLSSDNYRRYRVEYLCRCERELGRNLDLWEKEMFYYPQVCSTCFKTESSEMKVCSDCNYLSYCKSDHLSKNHQHWCSQFNLYHSIIRYQSKYGLISPQIPKFVRGKYEPLPHSINKYFESILPVTLDDLTFSALTDIATCPLTVVYALENCSMLLNNCLSLTVHIVGAEYFEISTMRKWESFIMHNIPELETLTLVFVGPELKVDSLKLALCKECKHRSRTIICDHKSGMLYHDYATSDQFIMPDIVCAFNAGIYRKTGFQDSDTWPPSIKCILDLAVPFVVTAYTAKELPLDIERIMNSGEIDMIIQPSKNPYASSKPNLNFVSDEEVPLIFKNYYISLIKGKK